GRGGGRGVAGGRRSGRAAVGERGILCGPNQPAAAAPGRNRLATERLRLWHQRQRGNGGATCAAVSPTAARWSDRTLLPSCDRALARPGQPAGALSSRG